jgi:flagellar capping protein FliD
MTSIVNWIAAYNYLFAAFNSENKELYVSGVG